MCVLNVCSSPLYSSFLSNPNQRLSPSFSLSLSKSIEASMFSDWTLSKGVRLQDRWFEIHIRTRIGGSQPRGRKIRGAEVQIGDMHSFNGQIGDMHNFHGPKSEVRYRSFCVLLICFFYFSVFCWFASEECTKKKSILSYNKKKWLKSGVCLWFQISWFRFCLFVYSASSHWSLFPSFFVTAICW